VCLFAATLPASAQTWITSSLTLSESNTSYDGLDLVISGAGVTVAMDGPHAFNSLLLTDGAVLTHSPCTETSTHKLDLTVTNAIVVSTDSRIDVSGKGYIAGRTTGNTTNGAAQYNSGASYGGLGASWSSDQPANAVYGDYAKPNEWGSGSGPYAGGAPGGGLIR